jgi:hypothetical protein
MFGLLLALVIHAMSMGARHQVPQSIRTGIGLRAKQLSAAANSGSSMTISSPSGYKIVKKKKEKKAEVD